jgi:two-component system, LytTR family, response regulator
MNRKINYLIVEDEDKSRETLLKKIEMCAIPDIVCTGMAANASEAILLAKLTPPDFLLLDINLPGKNGFELITEFNSLNLFPQVIFTSAHTESDILLNAIKKSPITYLVKPIDLDELEDAIKNVCLSISKNNVPQDTFQKIKLNAYNGPLFLKPNQILMIKSELHQSKLFCNDGECLLLNQNIGSFDQIHPLCTLPFFRADRSTIINLNHVEQFFPKKGECLLKSGNYTVKAEISQNGLKNMMKLIEKGY